MSTQPKTISEWFKLLPKDVQEKAINATSPYRIGDPAVDLQDALKKAFCWTSSKCGPDFWNAIYEKAATIHAPSSNPSALSKQEGGDHYKGLAIQPVEFCQKNNIPFIEGSVIKYVVRHRAKNGAKDIRKAIHFLELLLELEYKETK